MACDSSSHRSIGIYAHRSRGNSGSSLISAVEGSIEDYQACTLPEIRVEIDLGEAYIIFLKHFIQYDEVMRTTLSWIHDPSTT
jgi:hypothetical protein